MRYERGACKDIWGRGGVHVVQEGDTDRTGGGPAWVRRWERAAGGGGGGALEVGGG